MSDASGVQTVTSAQQVAAEAAPAAQSTDGGDYEGLKAEANADWQTFTVREREFRAVTQLPGIVLLDIGLAADPKSGDMEQLRAIKGFLKSAIWHEDQEAFDDYLREAEPAILIGELNKIVESLISLVSGNRPT